MPTLKMDRLNKLKSIVKELPVDSLYFWRWKMEKREFQCFGHGLEPEANLNFDLKTTVANPAIWYILLSQDTARDGITLDITKDEVIPRYGDVTGHEALAAYFGLTLEEEALIFKGESYFLRREGGEDKPEFCHPRIETVLLHIDRVIDERTTKEKTPSDPPKHEDSGLTRKGKKTKVRV